MIPIGSILMMFGWPEIIGLLVVVLVLFGARKLPALARGVEEGFSGFRRACRTTNDALDSTLDITMPSVQEPVADALTVTNRTAEDTSQPAPKELPPLMDQFVLWVAEGFGVGRIP